MSGAGNPIRGDAAHRSCGSQCPLGREALRIARRLYTIRRQRDLAFGAAASIFRDPAWDMMLDLFAARIEGRQISVSSAAIAAQTPQTTALRCIDQMVERGLLVRVPDRVDRRRSLLELTPCALDAMWELVARISGDSVLPHCTCSCAAAADHASIAEIGRPASSSSATNGSGRQRRFA